MRSGVKRIRLSCAVLGLVLAGAGHATVQTATVTKNALGPVVIPLFDSSLGTLLSVYAEATYTSWTPYTFFGTPVGYNQAVTGLATLGGFSFAVAGNSVAAQSTLTTGVYTVSATGTATWTNAADIALFAGTSAGLTGYVSNVNALGNPGQAMSGNYQPAVNYKVSYTYDNSPAVPEPATWAMMVGGFALTGMALRAARRSRATAETSGA